MLDATYRGRFPGNYTLHDLSMVFGGTHPIEAYLRDTVNCAFQRVHIEQALSQEQSPDWMPGSMLDWIKSQKSICKGLDLPLQLATSLVHQQYQERQFAACPDK